MEKVHLDSVEDMLNAAQSKLQGGFTKNTSPSGGSFVLTEAIAESIDCKRPLYTAFIDASKAFDVVWHDSMMVKLYDAGLRGRNWRFLNNWYKGLESVVKWEGDFSSSFQELQGVRQGGIWSPTAYKHYLDPLLQCVSEQNIGLKIGSIYCGAVAVADDVLFMSDTQEDLQCQLHVQSAFAHQERYLASDTKTKTMQFSSKVKEPECFSMNDKKLENVNSYKHLGLIRDSSKTVNNTNLIEERIRSARNTAYALMGAGLHGLNGVRMEVSISLWRIYIKPRLLYGLESINLSKLDILKLEHYQKNFLTRACSFMCSIYFVGSITGRG